MLLYIQQEDQNKILILKVIQNIWMAYQYSLLMLLLVDGYSRLIASSSDVQNIKIDGANHIFINGQYW